jgi:hypothetical protein
LVEVVIVFSTSLHRHTGGKAPKLKDCGIMQSIVDTTTQHVDFRREVLRFESAPFSRAEKIPRKITAASAAA